MKIRGLFLSLLSLVFWVTAASAMQYDASAAVQYANNWWNGRNTQRFENYHYSGGDCSNFVSQGLDSGFGGAFNWVPRYTEQQWNGNYWDTCHCKKPNWWSDQHGCMPYAPHLRRWLIDGLGCDSAYCPPFDSLHGQQRNVPGWLRPGDVGIYTWSNGAHFVIVIGFDQNGHPIYADHCGDGGSPPPWGPPHDTHDGDMSLKRPGQGLTLIHIPDVVLGCKHRAQGNSFDSTFKIWTYKHGYTCCWKERPGDSTPWTSNHTAYACLNWEETRGWTWDTLFSTRMNFAACSSIVLRQKVHSLLPSAGHILGSTDNGAHWTQTVGDQHTTEVSLPWATNQRDVRLAWCYHGVVSSGYWCIDDVELLARPTRSKDLCVTEIQAPCGIITQGKTIRPKVYIWNAGKQAVSASVRLTIGSPPYSYDQTQTITPYAYHDTMLEFNLGWLAMPPGTYTVTAYTNLAGDECRANDTASLTFQVLANTWTKMYPIYGGSGMATGACLATVDTNQIFCATGQKNFFAKYLLREDVWKTRAPTPQAFMNGGALAYPGSGDTLYAFRGNASLDFYKYSISANKWKNFADVLPAKVGSGAAMAYGGGGYIYALRGSQKRDFYRYSIASRSWQKMASVPEPAKIKQGASLVWTGGDSLYAFCGGDQALFYRYSISLNRWDARTSTPYNVDDGGALTYYPPGNKVYAFFGNKKNYFYAYNPTNGAWSSRQVAPNPVKNGGCLTYCDYSVFGGLGIGNDNDFWRYSPPVGGFLGAGGSESEPLEPALTQSAATAGVLSDHLDPGEQLTYDPTDKHTPQYSPNGFWIAYTASDSMSEGIGLYRIPAMGGMPDTLSTDSLTYETPKWTGDGTSLAAVADDGIYKVSSGIPAIRLAEGTVERPQVTGAWVVYEKWDTIDQTHDVCKVRLDGTGDTCLTSGTDEYLEPQPISDSDFVCLKLKDELYQVCRVTNGQEAWLTSDYMQNASLNLSPDKQWLTYEKLDESGYWQVYKMRVDGTDEVRITDSTCDCRTPVYSPDGRYIAYSKWQVDTTGSSDYSQICYKDLSSPASEVALNSANTVREHPCWSPDCRYIIYEVTAQSSMLGTNPKKFKQLGRAMTHIKPYGGVEEPAGLPRTFVLHQNRPNPFGRSTTIRYALPVSSLTELNIYDVTGRTVTRLVQSEQKPGYYSVAWKGTDARGQSVPAGTYFYVLKSNGKIAQKRMLLVR
jgi:hypothetical protein